eukprot:6155691-Amphidinium_carterae.2
MLNFRARSLRHGLGDLTPQCGHLYAMLTSGLVKLRLEPNWRMFPSPKLWPWPRVNSSCSAWVNRFTKLDSNLPTSSNCEVLDLEYSRWSSCSHACHLRWYHC